jgi:predicted house-cleaning noncanonical NTP pyrophosphatase (MazG superfamily)
LGKLVRDRIPEIIEASGRTPDVRVLDLASYEQALLDKLLEEAAELRDAAPEDRLEEAADVYEVLLAVADLIGVDVRDIVDRAELKRAERGGFRERLWLEKW